MTRAYSLTLNPRDPDGMPLDLMAQLWQAVGHTAELLGYRAYMRDETGAGVVWFDRETPHPPRHEETPSPLPTDDPPPPATEEYPPPLDPDCLAGKHAACHGTAWDEELDAEVECACGCHAVVNVVPSL